MKKTVLITGSSSGIGKETAIYFSEKGWNVVATMRKVEKGKEIFGNNKSIDIVRLDVLDVDSIRNAIQHAVEKYGKIDAVVNNAGYALMGPFEASTREQVKKQFETNVIGLMDVTRETIPVFRKQGGGTIINIASVAGRMTFPLYSIYNSTKWAVEGFSESLQFELREFNIRVKVIEPGIIKTDFYGRSMDAAESLVYDDFIRRAGKMNPKIQEMNKISSSSPHTVAKTIFRAANDKSWRLRYKTGRYAGTILFLRKLLPDRIFFWLLRQYSLK